MKKASGEEAQEFYEEIYLSREPDHDLSNAIDRSRMVARFITGESVLDLACGAGQLANLIDNRHYLGVDFSPSQVHRARLDCTNPNARFIRADVMNLPKDIERFDCVVLGEVLEQFEDMQAMARIAVNHAKGRVIVTVPVNMPGRGHAWRDFSKEDLEGIFGKETWLCEKFWCINKWYHWIAVWRVADWKRDLSVCIVCQDEEELLPYTLHCIEQAMLAPHLAEVVIVDGGSQDGTLGVIEEWKSKLPIVLLEHPYDTAGKQKNRGLDLCTGKWVLGLDADMTFTKNLGTLFANGYFNPHPIWDFRLYYTVLDEFHSFQITGPGLTTRLWRNEYRYTRDWHEQLPRPPERKQCREVQIFENSHLQTRKALLSRGVRWQPFAKEVSKVGASHGPITRYLSTEYGGRLRAKPFPAEIRDLIVPRAGLDVLIELDKRRHGEAETPLPQKVMEDKASRRWINEHLQEGEKWLW